MIRATGTVKETIEDGAYVNLDVRYGYIKLISTQADLCKEIKNVELTCPIEKGKIEIFKTIDLPKEIPPVCVPGGFRSRSVYVRMLTCSRAGILSRPTSTARTTSTLPA